MTEKKCCILTCGSNSKREADYGVTYHKFPKDSVLHDAWLNASQCEPANNETLHVCSRHFRKSDFQMNKDSKYMLKSESVPSIFPWGEIKKENMDSDIVTSEVNTSKESDGENVDDIKKFIEEQEKAILENNTATEKNESNQQNTIEENEVIDDNKIDTDSVNVIEDIINTKKNTDDTSAALSVATSVMDMILSESEPKTESKKIVKPIAKETLTTVGKGSGSMSLSVGSKVEAKDFGEYWYPAQIVEVDYEEMEVLVHYENQSKKHDEWISVSSPRLRPLGSKPEKPIPSISNASISGPSGATKEELHTEDKPKLMFVVGERCLARWRDNRRFVATVRNDLGDGSYEVVFDDGFLWKCKASRLYKLKDSGGRNNDSPSIDTQTPNPILSSILSGGGPSTLPAPVLPGLSQIPAFHTHLFDPARDYLGSKSERREKKRKINIKEIFNIGQKKRKFTPKVLKPVVSKDKHLFEQGNVKKDVKPATVVTAEGKQEVPDAVASIIGTIDKTDAVKDNLIKGYQEKDLDVKDEVVTKSEDSIEDPAEEELLENFETQDEGKHEEVIDRIKEVIIKLEGSLNKAETENAHVEPKVNTVKHEEVKIVKTEESIVKECNVEEFDIVDPNLKLEAEKIDVEAADAILESVAETEDLATSVEKPKKSASKLKRSKKLRLLQEKKVKKQVEKVKSELEEMKRQVEEMRKQMLLKAVELPTEAQKGEMPESFLLPGEWCCKWVNGQPVGTVSEIETAAKVDAHNKPALPRRSVQVEDKRLPLGWTKHMVRRSYGHSAGKWDVVLVSPDNRKLHTKSDMRNYMDNNPSGSWRGHEHALLDFGVHLKLSRRMGWVLDTPDGAVEGPAPAPTPAPHHTPTANVLLPSVPIGRKRKLAMKKRSDKIKIKRKRRMTMPSSTIDVSDTGTSGLVDPTMSPYNMLDNTALEDGYVYVGSLKVQIIENLLRCPAEGCFKNFRNNTLLKMHIKHYHRELRKMLGATPKVLDLAHARTKPNQAEIDRIKGEMEHRTIKVKLPRLPKRYEETTRQDAKETHPELDIVVTPHRTDEERIPRSLDSPKLRQSLMNKPPKRPRVLLPVRRPEPDEPAVPDAINSELVDEESAESSKDARAFEPLDFETAISTHTVTKPLVEKKKGEKRRKTFAAVSRSEEEGWDEEHSDVDTRSSCPRSGSPDSKNTDGKMDSLLLPVSSESNEEPRDNNMYMYSETGERIKLVHMKREEIINCHCGVGEEDGLMVQCELCLCWQHALCHNIHKESEVPEKYTCSICLNPRRGRRSRRFVHDQDRLYEGLLPGARPCDTLRRSHELAGNLLRVQDALHALRVKHYVATKKDHPKLYLWAKDWENSELSLTQQKLNSDYSDLNIMIADIGKENLPMKPATSPEGGAAASPAELEGGRYTHRESQLGPQALLGGLLASPGGASLDFPISTSELETLAKSVQAAEEAAHAGPAGGAAGGPAGRGAPQPEAPIEDSTCRAQLLRHIQRCQALVDARLDSIEAQVAELESQDPSFEDDETAEFFPRTKQTVQMLMRDLDTMEELGIIT